MLYIVSPSVLHICYCYDWCTRCSYHTALYRPEPGAATSLSVRQTYGHSDDLVNSALRIPATSWSIAYYFSLGLETREATMKQSLHNWTYTDRRTDRMHSNVQNRQKPANSNPTVENQAETNSVWYILILYERWHRKTVLVYQKSDSTLIQNRLYSMYMWKPTRKTCTRFACNTSYDVKQSISIHWTLRWENRRNAQAAVLLSW